eukprot:CAMPEP_0198525964 /NCGR_PEP_ID=MMETSP1462-20131121/23673_1 /TAXON_ID=1333877 /ORGANISM="Brandtodinium nutriculum, Strain RCC3387" /LENGTH=286 /DNA_ID=CAMNT_0044255727 /DNA_START=1 /DNA_END=861 /DNA_ORIENTATION=+
MLVTCVAGLSRDRSTSVGRAAGRAAGAVHHRADVLSTSDDLVRTLRTAIRAGKTADIAMSLHSDLDDLFSKLTPYMQRTLMEQILSARDESGCTALHWSAEFGYPKVALDLLGALSEQDEKYQFMVVRNNAGRTALHRAVSCGHSEVAKLLTVASGAQAQDLLLQQDDHGNTVLHLAVQAHKEVYKKRVALILDMVRDNVAKYQLLMVQNKRGWTALHVAAWYTRPGVANALIAELRTTPSLLANFLAVENEDKETAYDVGKSNSMMEKLLQKASESAKLNNIPDA